MKAMRTDVVRGLGGGFNQFNLAVQKNADGEFLGINVGVIIWGGRDALAQENVICVLEAHRQIYIAEKREAERFLQDVLDQCGIDEEIGLSAKIGIALSRENFPIYRGAMSNIAKTLEMIAITEEYLGLVKDGANLTFRISPSLSPFRSPSIKTPLG